MKFYCGTNEQKEKALRIWHTWFAWTPVVVEDGSCRWLENVWRKGTPRGADKEWDWEYRGKK